MTIAPTARIDPRASIGPGVSIGEYCVIEPDVAIGAGCRLEPYVYVKRWTTLGEANEISAGTVLGTDPLDKNFTGERSYLRAQCVVGQDPARGIGEVEQRSVEIKEVGPFHAWRRRHPAHHRAARLTARVWCESRPRRRIPAASPSIRPAQR